MFRLQRKNFFERICDLESRDGVIGSESGVTLSSFFEIRQHKPHPYTKMSTPRLALTLLLRASRSSVPRTARQLKVLPTRSIRAGPSILKPSQFRAYSQPPAASKIYFFEDVRPLHPPHTNSSNNPRSKRTSPIPPQTES